MIMMKKGLCIISVIVLLFVTAHAAEESILGLQDNGSRLIIYSNMNHYRFGIVNQFSDDLGINYPYIGAFQDGYTIFLDDLYGVLDIKGNTIIQPFYDSIVYLSNGVFCATNDQGLYLLSVSGKEVAFIQNAIAEKVFDGYVVFSIDGMLGLLLLDGDLFLNADYEEIDMFSCGILKFFKDDMTIYMNAKGEIIYRCSDGMRFSEDIAIVAEGGKTKIINTDGRVLYTADGSKIFWGEFSNGVCLAIDRETRRYGYIRKDGSWAIDPQYDWAYDFFDGYASVKIADKYGVIDLLGQFVVDCCYDDVFVGENGFVSIRLNDKYGVITTAGNVVTELGWDAIGTFQNNRCCVMKDGLWGYIDPHGALVVPCIYSFAENFDDGCAIVTDIEGYQWSIDLFGSILAPSVHQQL